MAEGEVKYSVRADSSQLDSDLTHAEKITDSKLSKIGGAAAKAGKIAGTAFAAIGSAALAVGTKAITGAVDFDQAMNQFAASTGKSKDELEEYEKTLKDIYANNYGESFEDISNAMASVTQQMGELDQTSLQNVTEGVFALSDVFGSDFNETLRGVDQLMLQFGLSSKEALDLLAAGSQSGLDYTDELGDNIAEYAGKFSQAGYSAEEYFQLLKNGTENGAYNLDKVNDSINEVTTRLADGTIGGAIGQFSAETQALFERWQNGGASQKQVIDSIVKDIANCTSEQDALTMAATAFGTMGEDANLDFIKSLSSVGDEFDNTKGKMEELKEVKYDDLGSMLEGLGRTLEVLLLPLGEQLIPLMQQIIESILPVVEENLPLITGFISELVTAFSPLVENLLPVIMELISTLLPIFIQVIEEILPPIIDLINLLLPPIMELVQTLLPPLIELFAALIEPLAEILGAILPPLIEVLNAVLEPIMKLIDQLLPPLTSLFEGLMPVFDALTPIIKFLAEVIGSVLGNAIEGIMPIINGIMDVLGNVIDFITGVFTGNWEQAWDAVVGIFKGIFNLIPTIVESIINGAIGIINGIISGINSLTGVFGIGAIPMIPNVSLPRFHTGGIVDFEAGEGPALLKDGEMVLTQKQQAELFALANGRTSMISGSVPIQANIVLTGEVTMDGFQVGKVVMRNLDDVAAFTLRG